MAVVGGGGGGDEVAGEVVVEVEAEGENGHIFVDLGESE